jgi:hypothetical protein
VAFKQEINVPLVVTIGAVSGFFLIVLVIGVQAWYLSEEQAEIAAKAAAAAPVEPLHSLKTDQLARLNAPAHWVDQNTGIVAVPIDQAEKLFVMSGGNIPTTTQPTAKAK